MKANWPTLRRQHTSEWFLAKIQQNSSSFVPTYEMHYCFNVVYYATGIAQVTQGL